MKLIPTATVGSQLVAVICSHLDNTPNDQGRLNINLVGGNFAGIWTLELAGTIRQLRRQAIKLIEPVPINKQDTGILNTYICISHLFSPNNKFLRCCT